MSYLSLAREQGIEFVSWVFDMPQRDFYIEFLFSLPMLGDLPAEEQCGRELLGKRLTFPSLVLTQAALSGR